MAAPFALSSSNFPSPLKPIFPIKKSHYLHFKRPSFVASSLQSSPPLDAFWQWLTDQSAVSAKSPARPGRVSEGLGLIAQRDISKHEVVLEIPKKLWINPDAVSSSDIGKVCSGFKPWISVALYLIREKVNQDSTWRPYLDILPQTTDSTIFWWVCFFCFWFLFIVDPF